MYREEKTYLLPDPPLMKREIALHKSERERKEE